MYLWLINCCKGNGSTKKTTARLRKLNEELLSLLQQFLQEIIEEIRINHTNIHTSENRSSHAYVCLFPQCQINWFASDFTNLMDIFLDMWVVMKTSWHFSGWREEVEDGWTGRTVTDWYWVRVTFSFQNLRQAKVDHRETGGTLGMVP